MVQISYKSNFEIHQGIYEHNSRDYYAILGVPVTANVNTIRKSYLKIAKTLHPDTHGVNSSPIIRNQANQYLAKLVNPAYSFLMAEKERSEYATILKLLAKRIIKRGERIIPQSAIAQNLLKFPCQANYEQSVEAIATQQYQQLDQILEKTGQLSEINLVYLLHQEGYHIPEVPAQPKFYNQPPTKLTVAEEYMQSQQWMMAVKELREYLQTDTKNSYCHALLGLAYKHQKLDGMAKVCFQQALTLNPQEPIALANTNNTPTNPTQKKTKSFFGWLGGE